MTVFRYLQRVRFAANLRPPRPVSTNRRTGDARSQLAAGVRDGEDCPRYAPWRRSVINPMTVSGVLAARPAQSIVERRRGWGCLCALARATAESDRLALLQPALEHAARVVASLYRVPTKLSPHSSKPRSLVTGVPPSAGRDFG